MRHSGPWGCVKIQMPFWQSCSLKQFIKNDHFRTRFWVKKWSFLCCRKNLLIVWKSSGYSSAFWHTLICQLSSRGSRHDLQRACRNADAPLKAVVRQHGMTAALELTIRWQRSFLMFVRVWNRRYGRRSFRNPGSWHASVRCMARRLFAHSLFFSACPAPVPLYLLREALNL